VNFVTIPLWKFSPLPMFPYSGLDNVQKNSELRVLFAGTETEFRRNPIRADMFHSNPSWRLGEIVTISDRQGCLTSEHSDHPPQIYMVGLHLAMSTHQHSRERKFIVLPV
jgi:hypothetical protein